MLNLINLIRSKEQHEQQELNILRIVFFIAGTMSPIITYLLVIVDLSKINNIYLGWVMSTLFLGLLILSYKTLVIKNHFSIISFVMFMISSMLVLFHSALNEFDYGYTLLFFLVTFSSTLFIRKLYYLIWFHTLILLELLFLLFYYESNSGRLLVLATYLLLIGITLVNTYLISHKQEKINTLASLIENINQSYSFEEILQYIYTSFSSYVPYQYIGIALIKEEGKILEASYGICDGTLQGLPENLIGLKVKLEDTSLKEVIESGDAKIINNLEEYLGNNTKKENHKVIMNAGIASSISFPLLINDRPVGVIFFSSTRKNIYTDKHVRFIETIASSISLGFEKCIVLDELIYNNIMSLVKLVELRDNTTGLHLERMKIYTKVIAQFLFEDSIYKNELSKKFIRDIEKFSPIHDIGKVGIRDEILLKPGELTQSEFEEMKNHTIYGAQIVKRAEESSLREDKGILKMGVEIIEGHHEKWDGSGYPYGKIGKEIPLSARIVAVSDAFDALTSERPYKHAFSYEVAFKILIEEKGRHFDPEIIRVLEKNKIELLDIYQKCHYNQVPRTSIKCG